MQIFITILATFFLILGFVCWNASGPDYLTLMLYSLECALLAAVFYSYNLNKVKGGFKVAMIVGIVLASVQFALSLGMFISMI